MLWSYDNADGFVLSGHVNKQYIPGTWWPIEPLERRRRRRRKIIYKPWKAINTKCGIRLPAEQGWVNENLAQGRIPRMMAKVFTESPEWKPGQSSKTITLGLRWWFSLKHQTLHGKLFIVILPPEYKNTSIRKKKKTSLDSKDNSHTKNSVSWRLPSQKRSVQPK